MNRTIAAHFLKCDQRPALPLPPPARGGGKRQRISDALLAALACALLGPLVPAGEDAPEAPADEKKVRERFLASYTSAEKPSLRADAAFMLKGVKEKESLRLLVGLLGDTNPDVRKNGCRVMAETPDPTGYFVKPLMGTIYDKAWPVRLAAVEALAGARVKAHATEALAVALRQAVDRGQDGDPNSYAAKLHEALARLNGRPKAPVPKDPAGEWMAWWKENKERLKKEDEAYLETVTPKPAVIEEPESLRPETPLPADEVEKKKKKDPFEED